VERLVDVEAIDVAEPPVQFVGVVAKPVGRRSEGPGDEEVRLIVGIEVGNVSSVLGIGPTDRLRGRRIDPGLCEQVRIGT